MAHKTRVAVLGGGVAAMTAAFELSRTEELRQKYDVTVYQMGWRLGGKGASGRAKKNGRIEEHGLHVWFGFYDNAFNMIKEVYKEADRPAGQPLATFEQAFQACDEVALMEQLNGAKGGSGGQWDHQVFKLPVRGKGPGGYTGRCPTLWDELRQMADAAWCMWEDLKDNPKARGVDPMPARQGEPLCQRQSPFSAFGAFTSEADVAEASARSDTFQISKRDHQVGARGHSPDPRRSELGHPHDRAQLLAALLDVAVARDGNDRIHAGPQLARMGRGT